MTSVDLKRAAATAREALLKAGKIVRTGFARSKRVSFKTKVDPVTHVDLLSEKTIISLIRSRFPGHGFLAEESGATPGAYRWVIDPLDGTANFLHGIPQSSVSIALEKGGQVLTGGVYDPFRDELFMATRGQGATLNGKRIRVSPENRLHRSMLITGIPFNRPTEGKAYLRAFETFMELTMGIRRFGSAAIDLAWIACGRAEGFWEFKLHPWDVAAGWLLIEEAGGKVTDFNGRPFQLEHPFQTLATNGKLHGRMSEILRVS